MKQSRRSSIAESPNEKMTAKARIFTGAFLVAAALSPFSFQGCSKNTEKPEETANTKDNRSTEITTQPKAPFFLIAIGTEPQIVRAGAKTTFTFVIKEKDTNGVPIPVTLEKNSVFHVMFTDEKLSYMEHTIGIQQPNNTYSTPVTLPTGGKYFVFVSFQPQDAYGVTFTRTVEVEGIASSTFSTETHILESSSDGITSRLTTIGDNFITGVLSMGFISLSSKGHSLDSSTIQNQYGHKAHLFLIGSTTKEYFHIYPEIVKDKFEFHIFFKKADYYQGRLMIMIKKKLHTFPLAINVLEGSTEGIKKLNDSHSDFHTSKTANKRND